MAVLSKSAFVFLEVPMLLIFPSYMYVASVLSSTFARILLYAHHCLPVPGVIGILWLQVYESAVFLEPAFVSHEVFIDSVNFTFPCKLGGTGHVSSNGSFLKSLIPFLVLFETGFLLCLFQILSLSNRLFTMVISLNRL